MGCCQSKKPTVYHYTKKELIKKNPNQLNVAYLRLPCCVRLKSHDLARYLRGYDLVCLTSPTPIGRRSMDAAFLSRGFANRAFADNKFVIFSKLELDSVEYRDQILTARAGKDIAVVCYFIPPNDTKQKGRDDKGAVKMCRLLYRLKGMKCGKAVLVGTNNFIGETKRYEGLQKLFNSERPGLKDAFREVHKESPGFTFDPVMNNSEAMRVAIHHNPGRTRSRIDQIWVDAGKVHDCSIDYMGSLSENYGLTCSIDI